MQVRTLEDEEYRARVAAHYGVADAAGTPEGVSEAIRAEAGALRVVSRAVLVARVRTLLGLPDAGLVREVARRLEDLGDLVAGPAGLVAAAPLRVVAFGDGQYALVGGITTPDAVARLGVSSIEPGLPRRLTLAPADTASFAARLAAKGGVVTTGETWAGLDRAPEPAAWLGLVQRAATPASGADDYVAWENVETYVPTPAQPVQAFRWRAGAAGGEGLVRAPQPGGWRAYAWTNAGGRRRLTADEARRLMLALDRVAGASCRAAVRRGVDGMDVTLETALPRAEYRYLVAAGVETRRARFSRTFRVAHGVWPRVERVLGERLGLVLDVG